MIYLDLDLSMQSFAHILGGHNRSGIITQIQASDGAFHLYFNIQLPLSYLPPTLQAPPPIPVQGKKIDKSSPFTLEQRGNPTQNLQRSCSTCFAIIWCQDSPHRMWLALKYCSLLVFKIVFVLGLSFFKCPKSSISDKDLSVQFASMHSADSQCGIFQAKSKSLDFLGDCLSLAYHLA